MTSPANTVKTVPADKGFADRDREDRFSVCLRALLKTEGGFVDHPNDRGGATNFGISLRFLRAEAAISKPVRALFPGAIGVETVRNMTVDQAAELYLRCFWVPAKCDALPRPIDGAVFDQAVNGGIRTAGRLLQKATNAVSASLGLPRLAEDGAIGVQTIAAAHRVPRADLIAEMRRVAANRYRGIAIASPSQGVFLAGWISRANALGAV